MKQVSVSKIVKPKASGSVSRDRLFARLDVAREKPVIWVSSPAGSGKTTLVAGYLEERGLPCLWYQIDAGDGDPATFFYYLGLAAARMSPRGKKPLPLLTAEYLLGIPMFARRYFEQLCSRMKAPCLIVLDDYQEAPADSGLHDALLHGIEALPEGVTVIVVSRGEPPPQMARLRANNRMGFLGWSDIRLTLDETEAIIEAAKRNGEPNPWPPAQSLFEQTDGWVAGLVMMLQGSRPECEAAGLSISAIPVAGASRRRVPQGPRQDVFDYFASVIFSKTTGALREFLLKTSLLPSMTARMAQELTGVPGSGAMLTSLTKNNYFTDWHPGKSPEYQYHPLFREFLQEKAREEYSAADLRHIILRAAAILEQTGRAEAAAVLYAEAEDWDGLVRIILDAAPVLIGQGRNATLEKWFSSLAEGVLEKDPYLLYWMGACRMPYGLAESRGYFERAFRSFETRGDDAGTLLAWSGATGTIIAELGDLNALDPWIGWLDGRMDKQPPFPSVQIETAVVTIMLIALSFRPRWHGKVLLWRGRAESLIAGTMDAGGRLTLGSYLLVHYVMFGLFNRATALMRTIRPLADSAGVTPLARIFWDTSAGLAANYAAGPETDGLAYAVQGLDHAEFTGIHVHDVFLLYDAALGSLLSGDLIGARKYLDRMMTAPMGLSSIHLIDHHLVSAGVCLRPGDLRGALEHFRAASNAAKRAGHDVFLNSLTDTGMALVLFELGEEAEADKTLRNMHSTGIADSYLSRYMVLLTEAYLAFRTGRERDGLDRAAELLAIGRKHGTIMVPFWPKTVLAKVCSHALKAGIEIGQVKELINRFGLVPELPLVESADWPWRFKVHMLGRLDIEKNGVPIAPSGNVKPLSLLTAIIAFGGRDVSAEQVADALWPDAEGDAAHNAFKMNLSRLRRQLGSEDLIRASEGRLTVERSQCWVDCWAFEEAAAEIGGILRDPTKTPAADTRHQAERITEIADKAVAFYRGDFLGGAKPQRWAVAYRAKLHKKFLDLLTGVGTFLERSGRWDKAAGYYEQALKADNHSEEACRGLMVCFHHLGRKADVMKTYRQCCQALASGLGIAPSRQTDDLYKSLIRQSAD